MSIPKPVYSPPFNVTRASHSVLTVRDLAASRSFYVDLLGFIVSDDDRDTLYLRGVSPQPRAQARERRAASRARRHARLLRGGSGKGEGGFRQGRIAGEMG